MVLITIQGAIAADTGLTFCADMTNASNNPEADSECLNLNGTYSELERNTAAANAPPVYTSNVPTYGTSGDGGLHSINPQDGNEVRMYAHDFGLEGSDEFTVTFWYRSGSNTTDWAHMIGTEGAGHSIIDVHIANTGNTALLFDMGSGDNTSCGAQTTLSTVDNDYRNGNWRHMAFLWNASAPSNEMKIFVNGTLNAQGNRAGGASCVMTSGNDHYALGSLPGGLYDISGDMDDVRFYKQALRTAEIQNLFNYGTINGSPAPPSNTTNIAWHSSSYPNSSHQNDLSPNFQVSTDLSGSGFSGNSINFTLWTIQNSTIDANDHWTEQTNASLTANNATSLFVPATNDLTPWLPHCDAWYWVKVEAEKVGATSSNTTKKRFYLDCINPIINGQTDTGIKLDNSSTHNKILNTTLKIKNIINDTYVFGWHMNITANADGSGAILWSDDERNITCADCNQTNSTSFAGWNPGTYYFHYTIEDDHTANSIPNYPWTTTSNSITYDMPTTTCTIESEEANLQIETTKLEDRYTWVMTTNSAKLEHGYNLICDKPIYKRSKYEFPSFVVGSQWIDFKIYGVQPGEYVVKRLSDTKINVKLKFDEPQQRLEYQSLGGLNAISNTHSFQILANMPPAISLTRQSYGPTWMNVSWSLQAGANLSELWYNSTLVYNGTATDFNITGLQTTHDHEVYVYAHNGTLKNISRGSGNARNYTTYRPAQPTNLQVQTNVLGWANITWSLGTGAESTLLYNQSVFLTNTTQNDWNFSGLTPSTSYTFTFYSQLIDDKWNNTYTNWTDASTITFTSASNTTIGINFYNLTNTTTAYDAISTPWQMTWIDSSENESGHTDWTTSTTTNTVSTSEICDGVNNCYVDLIFNRYNGSDGEQHFEFLHDYTPFSTNLYVIPRHNMSSALTVQIVSASNSPIQGAIVRVLSQASFPQSAGSTINAYGLIGQRFTKDEGEAVFYTETGKDMNIYVTKSGFDAVRYQIKQDEWVNDTFKIVLQEGDSWDWWDKIIHAPVQHNNQTFTIWLNDYKADEGTYLYNTSQNAALVTMQRTAGGLFFDAIIPGIDYTANTNISFFLWHINGSLISKFNVTRSTPILTNGTQNNPLKDLQDYADSGNTVYKSTMLALLIIISIAVGSYISGASPGFTTLMIGLIPLAFLAPAFWIPAVLASVYWIIKIIMRQVEGG